MPVPTDQRFRKSERLRLRQDYARVFAARCRRGDDALVVYVAPNDLGWSRLGLSVNKRIGNAVRRNYVRRRIREAFRTQKDALPKGLDIICVVQAKAAKRGFDLASSLRKLVGEASRGLARKRDRRSAGRGSAD